MQADEHIHTPRQELNSGHAVVTVSKQWEFGGESSSPVIASSLHCAQIARSSQAWEMGTTGLQVVRQILSVAQVSSDTAQTSRNTVTQYCSVFCLTAVIVSYCGCGWFRYNLQRRGHSLAGRVARFWCGMSLCTLQHASICIPEKQARMQVSQNREVD